MNNNVSSKESIQLLNATTSDSDSASDLRFSFAPPQPPVQARRKVRTKKKSRRESSSQAAPSSWLPCSLGSVIKTACISFAVGATFVLGWIVILLHTEVQQLNEKLSNIPSSSFNDDIVLGLKREVRELGLNQSLSNQLVHHYSKIINETLKETNLLSLDISNIKESLKAAPQMTNIGKELDSLKSTFASYEASVADLKLSIKEMKDTPLPNSLESIQGINTSLEARINSVVEQLNNNTNLISVFGQRIQNVTEQLTSQSSASDPSNIVHRVDAIHSALAHLEAQQINTTLTIQHVLEVLDRVDKMRSKP